jgi:hypothetical protein
LKFAFTNFYCSSGYKPTKQNMNHNNIMNWTHVTLILRRLNIKLFKKRRFNWHVHFKTSCKWKHKLQHINNNYKWQVFDVIIENTWILGNTNNTLPLNSWYAWWMSSHAIECLEVVAYAIIDQSLNNDDTTRFHAYFL